MRVAFFVASCAVILINSGCVTVSSYSAVKPQVDAWEKEREYGKALDALSRVEPIDPDYRKASLLRKQLEKKAADYEQDVRRDTAKKLESGDWAGALDQYDEALSKLPKSVVIRDGLARLHQQQREELDQLELQRQLKHGRWLRDVVPVFRDIANVDPRSSSAQSRLKRILDEAEDVAAELAITGNKAMANDDLNIADETLSLAYELHREPVIKESLNKLNGLQKVRASARRSAKIKRERRAVAAYDKKQRTISSLLKKHDAAYARQDYNSARNYLEEMERVDQRYSKLPSLKKTLQSAIDRKVSKLFDSGVSAYSRGLFEQAAKNWREALTLDPGHQPSKENLQRAEKVLQNIERLKEKQG
ncbi:MAG: hypothetical protein OEZ16_11380 [Chromatiales bacterium]|nr:hypothetical protein [Chromatiales bacterium]